MKKNEKNIWSPFCDDQKLRQFKQNSETHLPTQVSYPTMLGCSSVTVSEIWFGQGFLSGPETGIRKFIFFKKEENASRYFHFLSTLKILWGILSTKSGKRTIRKKEKHHYHYKAFQMETEDFNRKEKHYKHY